MSDNHTLFPIAGVMEQCGVKNAAFYDRLKFLGITPIKQGRNSYLNQEQIELLAQLDTHIKQTGQMNGFSPIVVANQGEIQAQNEDSTYNTSTQGYQLEEIYRAAQQHRGGVEVAKYAIASQLSLEDLPEDIMGEIEAARAATLPKFQNVRQTAGTILDQFRRNYRHAG